MSRTTTPHFDEVARGDAEATADALRAIWAKLSRLAARVDATAAADRTMLRLLARPTDPEDPLEDNVVIWLSTGDDTGDAGDLLAKIRAGGTLKLGTILDHSGL
jgi:hypothetical protein